jgi:hypothetical protein
MNCRESRRQLLPNSLMRPMTFRRLALPLLTPVILAWPVLSSSPAEAIPFSEADIFFELNATARDLGVHVSLDAESWKELRIEGPGAKRIAEVIPRGNLGKIGLTELFFEGEEPSLADVPFSSFLQKVPAGTYTFLGTTVENQPLRSTDRLTTDIPCPVPVVSPREDEAVPVDAVVVGWRAAPGVFNPDTRRCNTRREVGLVGYQVIVEIVNEDRDINRQLIVDLPADARQLSVTPGFIRGAQNLPGTEFKLEVLAIEDSGNKTITERNFRVSAGTGR